MKQHKVKEPGNGTSDTLMEWFNKPWVIFTVWGLLFLLTLIYSELSTRALLSAFLAWVGGLVTARLDYVLRRDRIYKDIEGKIITQRKFNRNVF